MADYVATTEDFKAVANAIRTKGGTSAPLSFPGEFASAIQAILGPKPEQEKELTITENGDYPIAPDVGKVLSKVLAHVNVPTGGGDSGGGGDVVGPFSGVVVNSFIPAESRLKIARPTLPGKALIYVALIPAMSLADAPPIGGGGGQEVVFGLWKINPDGSTDKEYGRVYSTDSSKKGVLLVKNSATEYSGIGNLTSNPIRQVQVGKLYYVVGFFN